MTINAFLSKRLARQGGFLLSVLALLCLYMAPQSTALIRNSIVILSIVLIMLLGLDVPRHTARLKPVCALLALLFAGMGARIFCTTWKISAKATSLAEALGLSHRTLVMLCAFFAAILSLYALYTLALHLLGWCFYQAQGTLFVKSPRKALKNLALNSPLLLSALCFYSLYSLPKKQTLLGMGLGLAVLALIFLGGGRGLGLLKRASLFSHVLALPSSIGIALAAQEVFVKNYRGVFLAGGSEHLLRPFSMLLAFLSLLFIYYLLLYCYTTLYQLFRETRFFQSFQPGEWIFYGLLFGLSLGLMIATFLHTEAFYGTSVKYDLLYTSDTSALVSSNVYLTLTNPENDLRQPLFAVFAAPFAAIPYFLTRIFNLTFVLHATLTNALQLVLLTLANLILTSLFAKTPLKRMGLMLILSVTYTGLLFPLMMEQYVIGYFWLMLCVYALLKTERPPRMLLFGAGGTLLTSMVLLPLFPKKNPLKQFTAWLSDCVKIGISFISVMLLFFRFDVFLTLTDKITALGRFTGKALTMTDKLEQYSHFVKTCFIAPVTTIVPNSVGAPTWKLVLQNGFSMIGLCLLAVILLSALLNIKKPATQLALAWVGFSVVMLVILGWGTKENGLNLYALYFGWCFVVLFFGFIERLSEIASIRGLFTLMCLCTIALLLLFNLQGIHDLLTFALTYYPTKGGIL